MPNLPVPVLATEVPGNFLTAALWLANVVNALTFALNPPDFMGHQTATQSIANTTWTALTVDAETVDTYGGHSTTTNTSRYVGQVAGYYQVSGVSAWAASSTGGRGAAIALNGTRMIGHAAFAMAAAAATPSAIATPTREVFLNGTTDYVEVQGYQASGGALATTAGVDVTSSLYVRWSHA